MKKDIDVLRHNILSAPTISLSNPQVIEHIKQIHKQNFNIYHEVTVFELADKALKLFRFKRYDILLMSRTKDSFELVGLPLGFGSLEQLKYVFTTLIDIGISALIYGSELFNLSAEPHSFNDTYSYTYENCLLYSENCSKSTKKQIRKFHKLVNKEVHTKELKRLLPELQELNNTWFNDFKKGDKKFKHNLNNIVYLIEKDYHINIANHYMLITYRCVNTDKLLAYDWVESYHGNTILAGGKSIIEGVSSFKAINLYLMELNFTVFNSKRATIGPAGVHKRATNSLKICGVGLAKSSIPHKRQWLRYYLFSGTKLYGMSESKSKCLF